MVLSSTFNNIISDINLHHDGQFYWSRKPEYPEKTTDLSQVTDKKKYMLSYSTYRALWHFFVSLIQCCIIVLYKMYFAMILDEITGTNVLWLTNKNFFSEYTPMNNLTNLKMFQHLAVRLKCFSMHIEKINKID
jgi:hypothetical protein